MRIGLDFDRVLFDTDAFDEFYKKETDLYHVEDPAPVKYGCYDPEMHAEICDVPMEDIWKVFENDLSRFLYDDIELLEELSSHELIIVTRGHEKFQRKKIEASGLEEKVEEVYVVQEELKNVGNIDVLVDDREKELNQVDIPGILINRPKEGLEKLVNEVDELEA